jgi:acetoin utilization deacetylase AcuC-like enzyme
MRSRANRRARARTLAHVLAVGYDPFFAEHDPGAGHIERAARLTAVHHALADVGVEESQLLAPRDATRAEIERVHAPDYVDALSSIADRGGGRLDPDTVMSGASWDVAVRGAGAGLAAIDALEEGRADTAFCALRPPGHHALPARAMGFCLLNQIAIAAAELTARGQRVLVLDWDAHHGNGTQDIFYADPDVLYVSLHEWPLYPGTGALNEIGVGAGEGTTCNLPLPAGATGDVYLGALDDVVAPLAERFAPDWLLVSAGYDAHRADPLTGLGLSAGDYADLTRRALALVPAGRTILFLEGGYDLDALRSSVVATLSAVTGGDERPEPATGGGPGRPVVDAARDLHLGRH